MEHRIWSMGILLLLLIDTKIGRKMEGKKKRERGESAKQGWRIFGMEQSR